MVIQDRFATFIKSEGLCWPTDRVVLAVSGGMDSMLMLHLFAQARYDIGVAHCNFSLRGAESDADEQLVRAAAKRLGLPFHTQRFDTEAYAEKHGISIQMAARDLRYAWLEEVRQAGSYDCIAVAHHLNDSLETALINWVRGTGLAGMVGISPKRGRIIRPLLFATRDEVADAVGRWGLDYREDASNRSVKYARNKIRLEVVPALKELNPGLEQTFATNSFFFSESLELVRRETERYRAQLLVEYEEGRFRLRRQAIAELVPQRLLVSELLRPFGFGVAAVDDLLDMGEDVSGKQFETRSHVLYVDREFVFIHPHPPAATTDHAVIVRLDEPVRWGDYEFVATESSDTRILADPSAVQFDAALLTLPLRVRGWRRADAFRPLGMRGSKKLSDYFVSIKIPRFQKDRVPIVTTAAGDIAWVAPYRMDDRFKITDKTKKVITLTCVRVAQRNGCSEPT